MSHFFNYDIVLCMNITDIDDKIIMRAIEAGITFDALARTHEASFIADMESLGVAPPDVMTRVSEYVPEVVDYISKIIERGYAYASNGSVYFNTTAYAANPHHTYGKLVPENVGNVGATEEGEGALSAGVTDKRAPCDFALWKASKPGEPKWPSPWGDGRPGWHIECSAMCGDTLGTFAEGRIDIHSGGVDLRFPHHENEIAQSEAALDCAQWTNYFLHSGHLNIEGLKMSKSLKNFVKIGEARDRFGARALRLLFLLSRYNAPMSYSERAMEAIIAIEKTYVEFFANSRAKLRTLPPVAPQRWGPADKVFAAFIAKTKADVREALCDDFNTPGAMAALADLVKETNKYMSSATPVPLLVRGAAVAVTESFRGFGLIDALPGIGFGEGVSSGDSAEAGGAGAGREETLAPVLDALAAFRERVRDAARAGDANAVLRLCDALRDEALAPLGIRLEDAASSSSSSSSAGGWSPLASRWKLVSSSDMIREADDKARVTAEKAAKKIEAAAEVARKALEKEEKAKIDPRTMFLGDTVSYSLWDVEGVPTHDAAGVELAKGKVKNLKKEWAVQERLWMWGKEKASGGGVSSGDAPPDGDA